MREGLVAFLVSAACGYAGYYLGGMPLGPDQGIILLATMYIGALAGLVWLEWFSQPHFGPELYYGYSWANYAPRWAMFSLAFATLVCEIQIFSLLNGSHPGFRINPGMENLVLASFGTKAFATAFLMTWIAVRPQHKGGFTSRRRLALVR